MRLVSLLFFGSLFLSKISLGLDCITTCEGGLITTTCEDIHHRSAEIREMRQKSYYYLMTKDPLVNLEVFLKKYEHEYLENTKKEDLSYDERVNRFLLWLSNIKE
jgi:hypothetical protein